MPCRNLVLAALAVGATVALAGATGAQAAGILVINGTGTNTVGAPLTAAGFDVYSDAFNPGVIASNLTDHSDIVEIWVWNDGTFGNTGTPADPSRAFNAADLSALHTFNAAHDQWIMDGLSLRNNGNTDQTNFTKNEGHAPRRSRHGGIVLGADDGSGAAITQHVNQVLGDFNFDLFDRHLGTESSTQQGGGILLSSPNSVNATGLASAGASYSELPHGVQPNGLYLSTAIFGKGEIFGFYTAAPARGRPFDGTT